MLVDHILVVVWESSVVSLAVILIQMKEQMAGRGPVAFAVLDACAALDLLVLSYRRESDRWIMASQCAFPCELAKSTRFCLVFFRGGHTL